MNASPSPLYQDPQTDIRHFLDLDLIDSATIRGILDSSLAMKKAGRAGPRPLTGQTLAMIFEKPSTRTRVSFEVAMKQLGGNTVVLRPEEMQLKRGETVADTARVLSRYVDAIMIRTGAEQKLLELAHHATVPVINGLTDRSHPCQILADILAFEEHRGSIRNRVVAWTGDANNVCNSWVHAAVRLDFELRIAAPPELSLAPDIKAWAKEHKGRVHVTTNAAEAVSGADLVTTDTWVSMGHEVANRRTLLVPYRVDDDLMALARPDALFMHCLPAHRGKK